MHSYIKTPIWKMINDNGPGCLLYKFDLSRAYRQLHTDPGDIHLLGYIVGTELQRVAYSYLLRRTTNAVSYLFHQIGHTILNYLDDFAGDQCMDTAWSVFT